MILNSMYERKNVAYTEVGRLYKEVNSMKSNFFLIYKYWSYNKNQLAKVLVSIIILISMLTVSIQLEQTECRRKYDRFLHRYGAANVIYHDIPEDIYKEISEMPEVVKAGQIVVCGKVQSDGLSYTYGAYADDAAREMDYLEVICGSFPKNPGEVMIYDKVSDDLFGRVDYREVLGKEIKFTFSDFEGNETDGKTLKIAGIVKFYEDRDLSELCKTWELLAMDIYDFPMPSVFLYHGECPGDNIRNYMLIELADREIITGDTKAMRFEFIERCFDRYKISPEMSSDGLTRAAEGVMSYDPDNELYDKIYSTDATTLIKYFSIIAVIISAISLLGILYSVMKARASSLRLIRAAGYSRLKTAGLVITEAVLLYMLGFVSGIITGGILYEIVLFFQKTFWGLLPLKAYHMEEPVRLVTGKPYSTALICSLVMFILAYIVYFLKTLLTGKMPGVRRRGRNLLGRVKRLVSGSPFANAMQVTAFSLILLTSVLFYMFFTIKGKGGSYFTNPELTGESYYSYAGINMKDDGVDCCIYNSINIGTPYGLAPDNYFGVDLAGVEGISKMEEVENIKAYNFNYAANIVYPAGDKTVPSFLRNNFKNELTQEMKDWWDAYDDYYQLGIIRINDDAADELGKYLTEGSMGKHENGIVLVLYGEDASAHPYAVGDEIPMEFFMKVDKGKNFKIKDRKKYNVVVDGIAVIPETAGQSDPITYEMFDDERGMMMAVTEKFNMETYKDSYDMVYISLKQGYDPDAFAKKAESEFIKSSMHVDIQTIGDCDRAFKQSCIERYLSIISIIVLLILMSIIGYLSLVSMIMVNCRRNISILRAMGMPNRKIKLLFVINNVKRTFISCIIGSGAVILAKKILTDKYNEAASLLEKNGLGMFIGGNVEENTMITELEKKFLLDYELHGVNVVPAVIAISLFLIAVTIMAVLFIAKRECSFNISDELSNSMKERE